MKFSLKTLVAAVALAAASSGASAAIDTGASGNGELFFNAWDANGSYSFDVNKTFNVFESDIDAGGLINQTHALTGFSSYLATVVDPTKLIFNLVAVDTSGARRILTTYATPVMPPATKTADVIRTVAGNISGFAGAATAAQLANGDSDNAAVTSTSSAWAGQTSFGNGSEANIAGGLDFSTAGKLTNNSFASGLGLLRINAGGTGFAQSTNTQYFDTGNAVKVWVAGNNLHIQAVPEPETYAMLLAGLGMLGFMARRRLNNRV